ncbi:MAG: hypothetical protein IB618_04025 [Candidatus Pacearchaeota archaeon]|nr:MAG: hypothetical protein IB618_04025 [Candidatus Pacearchaeota archaeon]
MKKILIKVLSIILTIILIFSLVLLAVGTLNPLYFWIILAFCAVIAFFGIPRLRKKK